MKRLNEEFELNEKLNKSKFAKEVMNLIAINVVADQELKDAIDKNENKTLLEFGKYVFFIANNNKQSHPFGNCYAMGLEEMSGHINNYFKDKDIDKDWIKKLEDDAKKALKDKDNEAEKVEKEAKDKLEAEEKQKAIDKANKLDLNTASLEDVKEAVDAYGIKVEIVPLEKQEGLIKITERDQYVNAINEFNAKKIKKEVKKKSNKPVEVVDEQQSIFDLG